MSRRARSWAALGIILALGLPGCGGSVSDSHTIVEPMTIEEVDGLTRITLTEKAVARLDIQTVAVGETEAGLTVPSDALFVDASGTFWLYVNPEPFVYVRREVGVVHDDGDLALLSEGPDPGTPVVTVGVPELYGAETGIGH